MQVWIYDKNKVFIESSFVEKLEENMTTVPLTIGYINPIFDIEKKHGTRVRQMKKYKNGKKKIKEWIKRGFT